MVRLWFSEHCQVLAKCVVELTNEIVAECFVKKGLANVGACLVADGRHLNSCVGHFGNWLCNVDFGDNVKFNENKICSAPHELKNENLVFTPRSATLVEYTDL